MNLTFIYNNDKLNLNIRDIKLSTHNPRYTTLSSIDESLIKKIKDLNGITQLKVQKTLLSNEGDFSDLKNLFDSILNIGFDSQIEPIIVIKGNDKEYIVAEGNRRIMCWK